MTGISLGGVAPSKIMVGGSEVEAVMIGGVKVWPMFAPSKAILGTDFTVTSTRGILPGLVADTANFPGSVVSGGKLKIQGSKSSATVTAVVELNTFYTYSTDVYLMVDNVQRDTKRYVSGTQTLSWTGSIPAGADVWIEVYRDSFASTYATTVKATTTTLAIT